MRCRLAGVAGNYLCLTPPLHSAFRVGMAPKRLAGSIPDFDKDWEDFSDSTTNAVNDVMEGVILLALMMGFPRRRL